MPASSAVVLLFDRLSQGSLGPYGNTVVRTPEFDALAAESFVFDQALLADPGLEPSYDALWARGQAIAAIRAAGITTCLVTDEPRVAAHPRAADFEECLVVTPAIAEAAAKEIAETGLARLFLAASQWLRGARRPFLLWIHARAMEGPWDAPQSLREQYVDEEDPPAPRFVDPPQFVLPPDYDPDQLLGVTQAYLGQVSLVDACLGALREELADLGADDALFCCGGVRGYPLGEHRHVGGRSAPLYAELLQIPLMLRLPDGAGALGRSAELVQLGDLAATLLAWSAPGARLATPGSIDLLPLVREQPTVGRQSLIFGANSGEQAVRTPAWSLRASGSPDARRLELFAKPSDRWEVNEVADRAPRIAEQLAELLAESSDSAPRLLEAALVEPVD